MIKTARYTLYELMLITAVAAAACNDDATSARDAASATGNSGADEDQAEATGQSGGNSSTGSGASSTGSDLTGGTLTGGGGQPGATLSSSGDSASDGSFSGGSSSGGDANTEQAGGGGEAATDNPAGGSGAVDATPTCLGQPAPGDVVRVGYPSSTANYACGPFVAAALSSRLAIAGRIRHWPGGTTEDYSGFGVHATLDALGELSAEVWTPQSAAGVSNVFGTSVDAGSSNLQHWAVWLSAGNRDRLTLSLYVRSAGLADYTTYDPLGVTEEALALQMAAVNETVVDGEGVLFGRVLDCDNRPVENALVSVLPSEGSSEVLYYDASLPTRSRSTTNADGRFFAPHLLPDTDSGGYTLQAWGFLTEDDMDAGCSGLTLLSEFETPASGDEILMLDAFPTEGDGDTAGGLLESGVELCRPADAANLADYSRITGLLAIRGVPMIPGTGSIQCSPGGTEPIASSDLDPLSGLLSVGGLAVTGQVSTDQASDGLEDLNGLGSLVQVNDMVYIAYNSTLTSLDGLSLESIGLSLNIIQNSVLTNLQGLSSLVSVGGDLVITDNQSLPTCEAEALRDRLLANGFTGSVSISGNDDTGTCE